MINEIKRDKYGRPRVYLEEECPVEILGIECQREGSAALHPPHSRLHVWWARRPLTVSRASILGSLLPAGYDNKAFLELMGVPRGADPIASSKLIDEVRSGKRKDRVEDPYGYPRAFTHNLSHVEQKEMMNEINRTWNLQNIKVLDAFSGGGSIPFESVRMGFDTIANELNPVASIIERATIEYPMKFGPELVKDIEKIGREIEAVISKEMGPFFPRNPGEEDLCYIWVRTAICPGCDLRVPLAPNWWLSTEEKLGYKMVIPSVGESNECSFIIKKQGEDFDPEIGTIKRAIAACPRCGHIIDGKAIKEQAQKEGLGHQLGAVGYKMQGRRGRFFREAQHADLDGIEKAEKELMAKLPGWQARGLVPEEMRYIGPADRSINYGVARFRDLFGPRQLLVHLTTLQAIIEYPWAKFTDEARREALRVYLQIAFDKGIDYNAILNTFESTRVIVKHVFQRHDFAFKWSYGEIDGAGNLFRFSLSQIADAYSGISKLSSEAPGRIDFVSRDACDLPAIADKSITLISIDPPYYDNVMYSECSDFFYVWMKRGIGDQFPGIFSSELTNKTNEAVANSAQFKSTGRGDATKLAAKDYEAKMLASFTEMHRVLKNDGVMTIMFTHKKVEAWDTMAQALLEAGFMITASWPIHTESEYSLHQAKKNAAASTILLVCRKRPVEAKTSWWDDVQVRIDDEVRVKAEQFENKGLRGQDTFIACFGPALQVLSENWPVKKKDGTIIRPDEALDRARATVSSWFMDRIAEGQAATLDAETRFYILAWHLFHAREFPFDEARKLGISLNIDVDNLTKKKVLEKKGNFVRFLKPDERARKGAVKPETESYDTIIDLVQAAMLAYKGGQSVDLKRFHQRTGALTIKGYKQAIEYLLDVLPRTDEVEEYAVLNAMWESNYPDIKRKVVNTDPTGEKVKRLESFDQVADVAKSEVEDEIDHQEGEESDDQ